jgi:hypothetical protein
MKLRRILMFSVVIVSLTLVAIAAPDVKEFDLKFKGEGAFVVVLDDELDEYVYIPPGGFELLNVSHLGLSEVAWKIRYSPPPEGEPFGWFTITGANGDGLEGIYDGFAVTPDPEDPTTGTYDLDWLFTGGTGRFEGALGTGHTDGLVDFLTGEAKYQFSGTIIVPKGK